MHVSEWITLGVFIAGIIVTIHNIAISRREKWRAHVEKELTTFRRKFDRIEAHFQIDLKLDDEG